MSCLISLAKACTEADCRSSDHWGGIGLAAMTWTRASSACANADAVAMASRVPAIVVATT
jgi:hypothetical protein